MKSADNPSLNKITTLGFVIICILTFIHNGTVSLWDQDEAAYAGFAKNMIESGNYLIPEFVWSEIHRKPPLHFWSIALSYKIFGISEFALRFFSAIAISGVYFLIWFWGKKLFSPTVSKVATIVLGTSLLIPFLAKVAVTDALMLLFSTICALSLISILNQPKIKFVLLFWSSFALGLLTKGPPIIIFTFSFIFLLFIFDKRRKNLLKLKPWFFLPLALAPFAYWCYQTYLIDGGEFLSWMLDWYVLKRISGSVLGQSGPPGTHFLIISVSFLLYAISLPKAYISAFKAIKKRQNNDTMILALWFVAAWLIYEFSPSKLPAYCIAAHVPLSILIGKEMVNLLNKESNLSLNWQRFQFSLPLIISVLILTAAIILRLSFTLNLSAAILVILLLLSSFFLLKRLPFSKRLLLTNTLFISYLIAIIYPQIDQVKNSSFLVADYIESKGVEKDVIYIGNSKGKPPSLPFYCEQVAKKVVVCKDQNKLIQLYQEVKNAAFVLNEEQKKAFENNFAGIEIKQISSFYVDRKGTADYYLILN